MADLTLLDLAARTGSDALTGLIEDVVIWAPEFGLVPAIPRAGTTYKITRRTSLPVTQFRDVNSGVNPSKSIYKQEVKEMFFLDTILETDEAIVMADDRKIGDVLTDEARGALESNTIMVGSQFWYGRSADPKGFVGLSQQVSGLVEAGGTTGTCSAYLVCLDEQGVTFDVGNNGQLSMPPFIRQQITNTDGTKKFVYTSNLAGYLGLSVKSAYSVWQISGISPTIGGSYPMTDKLGSQLIQIIPVPRRKNLRWFMNRDCLATLQASRTAIGYQPAIGGGGQPAYAPYPDSCQGFPITLTDSLVSTETSLGSKKDRGKKRIRKKEES